MALSLLATLYPAWFVTICIAHWLVMSLWIDMVHHESSLCASRCEEIIFNIALGLAYIIAIISPKDGPTRYSYLAYYLVCFIENTATLVVWYENFNIIKIPCHRIFYMNINDIIICIVGVYQKWCLKIRNFIME